ncbi:MAG: serine hydrolase [Proteobacteria bacterium]|nr:serine hydrolase [Pseudomonadota bacterium]
MDRRTFLSTITGSLLSTSAPTPLGPDQTSPAVRFSAATRYSARRGGAALIVVRNGVVLAEDYPSNASDGRWPLGKATRALAPLIAAQLVHDHLLAMDEPAALTLGEWGADAAKTIITARSLLNGTSGLAFPNGSEPTLTTALSMPQTDQIGARFIDDAAPYVIFAEIVRRKLLAAGVDSDPAMYLTARTLDAIGCTPIGWSRQSDGAPRIDTGAFVNARGWASVGEFIRRGGVWRAEQLVDNFVLSDALRGSPAEPRAGFGFWLAAPSRQPISCNSDLWQAQSPAPSDLAMAAGDGGQRLYIVPSRALVIARLTSSDAPNQQWSDAQFLSLLWPDL